ncbi:MAG: YihY/virulence factor BrkB family protein, partial [Microthrixaceae bacterium]
RILKSSDRIKESVLDSTIVQFPVIGSRIEENVSALGVKGPWIWISLAGLLWTATGIYNGFQLALNQVWNVAGVERQGFVSRLVRSLLLFVLVFAAAVGTSFLRDFYTPSSSGLVSQAISLVTGSLLAALLLFGVFRIVVAPAIASVQLILAAAVAGVAWQVIQRLGSWLILDRLSQAQDLYGAIGFVVVTLFWINLLARSAIFANEVAVVQARRLWPRRIAQPPLSEADCEVLVGLLSNELRRPEQTLTVDFDKEHLDKNFFAEREKRRRESDDDCASTAPTRWVLRGGAESDTE